MISKFLIVAMALLAAERPAAAMVPADAAALLDRAARSSDLRREGSRPIRLRARVVATDVSGERFEGNYHLLWVSPTAWREEVAFSTFWEVRGRSDERSWRIRKLDYTPEPVRWLRRTIEFAERLERQPSWEGDPLERKKVRGKQTTCAEVRPNGWSWRRWCFDVGTGDPIREEGTDGVDTGIVYEYGGWREAEGRRFPGSIVYKVSKRARIELAVSEFEEVKETDPAWFVPPRGAEEDPICESLEPPVPPPEAKLESTRSSDGKVLRGLAALEFRVAVDGSVRGMKIVSASSREFGRAFAEQISKLTFRPAMCDGRPVEMDYAFRKSVR